MKSQDERNPTRLGVADLAVDIGSLVREVGNDEPTLVDVLEHTSRDLVAGTPLLVNAYRGERCVWVIGVESLDSLFDSLTNAP